MQKEKFSDLLVKWEEELSVKQLAPLKEDFVFSHAFLMAFLGNNSVEETQDGDFTKYILRSFSGKDTFTIEKSEKRLSFERKNPELHYRSVYDISVPNFVKCTSSWESSPLGKKQRYEAEVLVNSSDGVYDSKVSEKEENWVLDSFLSAELLPPEENPRIVYRFRQPEFERTKISGSTVEQVPFVSVKGIPSAVDVLDDCFSAEAKEIPYSEFVAMRQKSRKKYEDIQRVKDLLQKKKEKEKEKQRLELARLAAANLSATKMTKRKKEKDEQKEGRK